MVYRGGPHDSTIGSKSISVGVFSVQMSCLQSSQPHTSAVSRLHQQRSLSDACLRLHCRSGWPWRAEDQCIQAPEMLPALQVHSKCLAQQDIDSHLLPPQPLKAVMQCQTWLQQPQTHLWVQAALQWGHHKRSQTLPVACKRARTRTCKLLSLKEHQSRRTQSLT